MIESLGERTARLARRWVPDPFIFAILLTILTALLAVFLAPDVDRHVLARWAAGAADRGESEVAAGWRAAAAAGDTSAVGLLDRALQVLLYWIDPETGFWRLLAFGMQMTVILVTGYALAVSPPVRRIVDRLARVPRGAGSAAALVALVAVAAAFLHWGLGLIVGALLAREVGIRAARRGVPVHYPLLGAAGYAGLMVWHGGWSGSGPLKFASGAADLLGDDRVIPLSATIFSAMNITVAVALLVLVPLGFAWLAPRRPEAMEACPLREPPAPEREEPSAPGTPADRLDGSRLLAGVTGALGVTAVVAYAATSSRPDQLAVINGLFLFAGLLLHGTPRAYLRAVAAGAHGAAGIILQFPFYAGIMGMMAASGLARAFSDWCVTNPLVNETTFAPLAFVSAGIVNLFVPSGGGQVAVQGKILLDVARGLGVPEGKAVMALAYGDQLTNMLQPFWALALLGITGLKARQIIGYTLVVMVLATPVFIAALLLF